MALERGQILTGLWFANWIVVLCLISFNACQKIKMKHLFILLFFTNKNEKDAHN